MRRTGELDRLARLGTFGRSRRKRGARRRPRSTELQHVLLLGKRSRLRRHKVARVAHGRRRRRVGPLEERQGRVRRGRVCADQAEAARLSVAHFASSAHAPLAAAPAAAPSATAAAEARPAAEVAPQWTGDALPARVLLDRAQDRLERAGHAKADAAPQGAGGLCGPRLVDEAQGGEGVLCLDIEGRGEAGRVPRGRGEEDEVGVRVGEVLRVREFGIVVVVDDEGDDFGREVARVARVPAGVGVVSAPRQ